MSIKEAVEARQAEAALLAAPIVREPVMRADFSAEFLLSTNLVDGMTTGDDEAAR